MQHSWSSSTWTMDTTHGPFLLSAFYVTILNPMSIFSCVPCNSTPEQMGGVKISTNDLAVVTYIL